MKKIILTGATDGIGLATAKRLASQHHHLLLHGRSDLKLTQVANSLRAEFPNVLIETYRADLSSFREIKQMLDDIMSRHSTIDVLINNAGILKSAQNKTESGLDIRFMVNTIAPYILAETLLPLLAEDGRIVNLSSAAQAQVDLDVLKGLKESSDALRVYAQSKLALTLWSCNLATRMKSTQVAVAVNPGSLLASKMVKEGFGVAGGDLNIGASIVEQAALSQAFGSASGKYYDNDAQQFALPHVSDPLEAEGLVREIGAIVDLYFSDS